MRRLAFLLRPGWIALAVVVVAFTYLCFSVLAPWQLGKNTKTSRENDQIQQSLTTAPVAVENAFAASGFIGTRRAMAQSDGDRALPAGQATGGPAAGGRRRPGDGGAAAVRRRRRPDRPGRPRLRAATAGFAGAADRATARRDGDHHGTPARLRGAGAGQGVVRQRRCATGVFDQHEQIATLTGVPLAGSYLQLVDDQPGGLGVIGLPHLDAGPFLSYGIQWITFGVVAPILLGYFVYAEVRARRADKAQASPAKTAQKPATVEDKLTDRYGRRR